MSSGKILIVDDEQDIRTMLTEFLEMMDYEVITAENGQDGIEKFKETAPDVVITDIKMPVKNGVEFINELIEMGLNPKVIFVTGWDKELGTLKSNRELFSKFICLKKPFEMNELITNVQKAIEG